MSSRGISPSIPSHLRVNVRVGVGIRVSTRVRLRAGASEKSKSGPSWVLEAYQLGLGLGLKLMNPEYLKPSMVVEKTIQKHIPKPIMTIITKMMKRVRWGMLL